MNKAKNTTSRQGEPIETLASNVGERLRNDILECRLEPGARLRIAELREKYDIGISPLREALMRLTSEGLVELEDHRGFRVTPVSKDKLLDITFMRKELEGKAIRLSIEHGDAQWQADVVSAFDVLSRLSATEGGGGVPGPEWEQAHRRFHAVLGEACGSEWLVHFRTLLYDQWDRYRRLWFRVRDASPARDIHSEHRQLMDAVVDRDADAAVFHMQRHISASTRVLLQAENSYFNKEA